MYDMYPDWGPARHRDDNEAPPYRPVQTPLDLRDNGGGERPEDN